MIIRESRERTALNDSDRRIRDSLTSRLLKYIARLDRATCPRRIEEKRRVPQRTVITKDLKGTTSRRRNRECQNVPRYIVKLTRNALALSLCPTCNDEAKDSVIKFQESSSFVLLTANSKGSNKIKAVFHIFRHVLSIMCVSSLQ